MTVFLGFISREMKDNAEISKGIVFFYVMHVVKSTFTELFVEGFIQVFP
jgi:hypothetical protein